MSRSTLLEFARVNDVAAGTTKKLQKQAALAGYFKGLGEDDLRLAVRFASGRAFPATTETVLNVGGATVWGVALGILGVGHEELRETVIRSGEIGEALGTLWGKRRVDPPAATDETQDTAGRAGRGTSGSTVSSNGGITLEEMEESFKELAATGNGERKREILWELFARCVDPREAAYLAKVIFRDMRTGVQEGVLQAAVAEAFGKRLEEIQRTQLLVGDLEQVAVLARGDRLGEAKFALFHPIQFMLATPQETFAEAAGTVGGRAYFAEDKLDGIRAQVHKAGEKVYIYTRTMDRTEESFPDVVGQIKRLPGEFLLDGEIVPYEHGEVLPFAHIQRRLGRKVLTPKILRENPCRFVAFDVLFREGRLLMDLPLRERRRELDALCEACPAMRDGEARGGDVDDPAMIATKVEVVSSEAEIARAFEAARGRRNEGVILKDPESAYSPGRRGKWWLKLKTHLPTLDCVVTAAEYGHGKRRGVLSDYTFAVWDREPTEEGARLVNVGKAFTGLTDAEIAEYTQVFLGLSRGTDGRVHRVEPKVVLEVACDQIQKSARHESGFALRFPRIKRVRTDKGIYDADRLARVEEVYASQGNFAKRKVDTKPPPTGQLGLFDGM